MSSWRCACIAVADAPGHCVIGDRESVPFAFRASGPPVVLLHGFPDSWRLWRHQIRLFAAAGYRVIDPDLRALVGRPDRRMLRDYRMSVLVGNIAGLLDGTGVDRAAVVSHDWGAVLAWQLAGSLRQRVHRWVVVSMGHPAAGVTSGAADQQQSPGICGGSCLQCFSMLDRYDRSIQGVGLCGSRWWRLDPVAMPNPGGAGLTS